VSGHPAKFTVTNMDRTRPPPVQINIEGPSKARLGHRELDDGFEFTYLVGLEGDYCVSVTYADQIHIPGSPFRPKFSSKLLATCNWLESYLLQSALCLYSAALYFILRKRLCAHLAFLVCA